MGPGSAAGSRAGSSTPGPVDLDAEWAKAGTTVMPALEGSEAGTLAAVAEPIASKEPIDVLKQLKHETLDFCGDWYEWRWRDRNWLDARPEMETWKQVRDTEAKATTVRRHAQEALTELLKFADSYEKGTGGLTSEGLALAARPARTALRRMHEGVVINLPIVEPSRTQLLPRIASMYVIARGYRLIEVVNQGPKPVPPRFRRDDLEYAKKFSDIKPRELAIYTLLAGFWPTSIKVAEKPERGTRRTLLLGNGRGVSVSQVLTEEQKYVRKALELLKK